MGGCSTARSMPWHLPSIHVANRDAWRGGSADGELSLTGMLSCGLGLDHGFRLRCTSSTWGEAWIMVDESGHKRVGGGNLAGCDFQVVSLWVQDAALALFGTQQHTRIALNAGTVRLRGLGECCWWKCETGFRSAYWKRHKYLQGCVVVWTQGGGAEGVLVGPDKN